MLLAGSIFILKLSVSLLFYFDWLDGSRAQHRTTLFSLFLFVLNKSHSRKELLRTALERDQHRDDGLEIFKKKFFKTLISRRDIVTLCIHSATITPKRYTGERVFQYMTSEYLEKKGRKRHVALMGSRSSTNQRPSALLSNWKKNDGNIIAWDSPIRLTTATTLPTPKKGEKNQEVETAHPRLCRSMSSFLACRIWQQLFLIPHTSLSALLVHSKDIGCFTFFSIGSARVQIWASLDVVKMKKAYKIKARSTRTNTWAFQMAPISNAHRELKNWIEIKMTVRVELGTKSIRPKHFDEKDASASTKYTLMI